MDKRGRQKRQAHLINFLYSIARKDFKHVFKSFPVINSYERDIDKEVMCMINAVINDPTNSASALHRIIGLFFPLRPHDWITSDTFMQSFASININSYMTRTVRYSRVLPKLITLRAIYQAFDNMEEFCLYFHPKHPQQSLYENLYTKRSDDNYSHPGIALALMWLIRKNSDYALGLWNNYNQKDLVAPMLSVIERRAYRENLISRKERNPEIALTKFFYKLDKKDPLKYIPLLAMKSWDEILYEAGYVRT
ncbi:MAG: DUF2400 family protein [Bacteroides sp.]